MPVTYSYAPEVEVIAATIIGQSHTHLAGEPIRYIFRSEAKKKNGRVKMGEAKIVKGFNAFLAMDPSLVGDDTEPEELFVIEVAKDIWIQLEEPARRALVDHELAHCLIEYDQHGGVVYKVRAHDVEEFNEVIERHGLWRRDVRDFARLAVEQLELEMDPPKVERVAAPTSNVDPDTGEIAEPIEDIEPEPEDEDEVPEDDGFEDYRTGTGPWPMNLPAKAMGILMRRNGDGGETVVDEDAETISFVPYPESDGEEVFTPGAGGGEVMRFKPPRPNAKPEPKAGEGPKAVPYVDSEYEGRPEGPRGDNGRAKGGRDRALERFLED